MLVQSMPFPLNLAGGNVTFVGSHAQGFSDSGGTLNFSSLLNAASATPTVEEGDMVLLQVVRFGTGASVANATPTGYTALGSHSPDGYKHTVLCYKFMGASPDSGVTIANASSTSGIGAVAVTAHVLRGIDPTYPADGSVVKVTADDVAPNAGAVTVSTEGGIAFVSAAMWDTSGNLGTMTRPTNLDTTTNAFRAQRTSYSGYSGEVSAAAGIKTGASGSFDPDAFGVGTSSTDGYNTAAFAIALRPYAAPVFGVTLNDTISLSYTITGSPIGTASAWSWRKDGVEVSTTEAGPTPDEDGAVYTLRLTMANGPYSASVESAGLTYSEGNLLQSSGGDAILIESGGDNILIREFE